MVNCKQPWRGDLKEAYDRAKEQGLLPNDLAMLQSPAGHLHGV